MFNFALITVSHRVIASVGNSLSVSCKSTQRCLSHLLSQQIVSLIKIQIIAAIKICVINEANLFELETHCISHIFMFIHTRLQAALVRPSSPPDFVQVCFRKTTLVSSNDFQTHFNLQLRTIEALFPADRLALLASLFPAQLWSCFRFNAY